MWGRLAICGRLAIGLCSFAPKAKRITNPLQVGNLAPLQERNFISRSKA